MLPLVANVFYISFLTEQAVPLAEHMVPVNFLRPGC